MQLDLPTFTDTELRKRKLWLYFLIVPSLIFVCILSIGLLVLMFSPDSLFSKLKDLLMFTSIFSLIFGPRYILYRCAYKKPGTALLTFTMIFQIINILSLSYLLFLPFPWNWISYLPLTSFFGFCWYLNWHLRKINKKLRECEIVPQEFKDKLALLNQALNREELDVIFSELIRAWPQYEPNISQHYRTRLSSL